MKKKLKIDPNVLAIIRGLVARLDQVVGIMVDAREDGPMTEYESETRAHIDELGVAGFYKPMIVKIQLPLSSNVENPGALIYNEDRSFLQEMNIDPDLLSWFGNGEVKIYAKARRWADGNVQVVSQVEQQPW